MLLSTISNTLTEANGGFNLNIDVVSNVNVCSPSVISWCLKRLQWDFSSLFLSLFYSISCSLSSASLLWVKHSVADISVLFIKRRVYQVS